MDGWDDGMQSGECGELGLIVVGSEEGLGAGKPVGTVGYVPVGASTVCQRADISRAVDTRTLFS